VYLPSAQFFSGVALQDLGPSPVPEELARIGGLRYIFNRRG